MNWLDHFTDEQRHAHSLQSIALRNRRIRRVSSSTFGQLGEEHAMQADNVIQFEQTLEQALERLSHELDRVLHEKRILLDVCEQALSSARMAIACEQPINAELLERLMERAIREATR